MTIIYFIYVPCPRSYFAYAVFQVLIIVIIISIALQRGNAVAFLATFDAV